MTAFGVLHAIDGRVSEGVPARMFYGPGIDPSPDLERRFFTGLRLPNGTFKTTYDRRLDDLNSEILPYLPDRRMLRAKDVGVSSGISTLEWYDALAAAGIRCEITATDLLVRAWIIEYRGGLTTLVTTAGEVLQIDVDGFVFRPDQIGRRERFIYRLPLALIGRSRFMTHKRAVELVSTRLIGHPHIRVVEEDLHHPSPGQWDIIRVANVLNRGYFSTTTLRALLLNLIRSLVPGGVLAICRTVPESGNHASILRLEHDRLVLLSAMRGGSEVQDVALEIRLSDSPQIADRPDARSAHRLPHDLCSQPHSARHLA